jgi:hypothetical protein
MGELSSQTFIDLATTINATILDIFTRYPPEFTETYLERDDGIANITIGYVASDEQSIRNFVESALELMSTVLHSIFTSYGFKGDEDVTKGIVSKRAQDEVNADLKAIDTVVRIYLRIGNCPFLNEDFANTRNSIYTSWWLQDAP